MEDGQISDLILRLQTGDDAAKAQFYTEYGDLIARAVLRKLFDLNAQDARDEAEDIANEILTRLFADECKVFARIHQPASIRAWLVTVSRNFTVTYLRKKSVRGRAVTSLARETVEAYSHAADQSALDDERSQRVQQLLKALPEDERLIVQLYFLQGLKYAEVAEMLRMNINTVSSKLRRAKQKLRAMIGEEQW